VWVLKDNTALCSGVSNLYSVALIVRIILLSHPSVFSILPLGNRINNQPNSAVRRHIDATDGCGLFRSRPYVCVSGTAGAVQTYVNSKKMPPRGYNGLWAPCHLPTANVLNLNSLRCEMRADIWKQLENFKSCLSETFKSCLTPQRKSYIFVYASCRKTTKNLRVEM
jgi:hypothetical protein